MTRLRIALTALPFLGLLVAIPFVNRLEPYVLGLPFLAFWCLLWVVLTSVIMTIVYRIDPANRPEEDR